MMAGLARTWFIRCIILFMPGLALAEELSQSAIDAFQDAGLLAQTRGNLAAAQSLLEFRAALPDPGDDPQLAREHSFSTFVAGVYLVADDDHAAALPLMLEASQGFRALDADYLGYAALALEYAAFSQDRLLGPAEAYGSLIAARALRRQSGAPPDWAALQALRFAGHLAMRLRDVEAVSAEAVEAIEFAAALGFGEIDPMGAPATALAAQLAGWAGAYPAADMLADVAIGGVSVVLPRMSIFGQDLYGDRELLCNEFSSTIQGLAGLRIDYGNYAGASSLLTIYDPVLRESPACSDVMQPAAAQRLNTLMARLHLRSGEPIAAHLRLRSYADQVQNEGPDPVEPELAAWLAAARQAEARLALGFPSEAAALLAEVPEGLGLQQTAVYERERLLAVALRQLLVADRTASLETLQRAGNLQREMEPLHWFPRAEIAYRRALILIEMDEPDEALAVRDAFERELAEIIEAGRNAGRELDALFAEDQHAYNAAIVGEDYAAQIEGWREEGRFETPAFRQIDAMRALFDLSMAVHHGDRQTVVDLFESVPSTGLPSGVGLVPHAQRAYLLGCLRTHGPGLHCESSISRSFQYPASPPVSCATCGLRGLNEANELFIAADMVRRAPLVAQFAEPVLRWLFESADEARRDPFDDSAAAAWISGLSQRRSGGDLIFEITQRMIEGGAAAAVGQVGAHLASGSDELADLLRRRDQIGNRLDTLFRSGSAEPGEMDRLTSQLHDINSQLNELRPDYASIFDPEPLTIEEISNLLPRGGAFVLVTTTEAATYSVAVRDDEFEFHRAPIGADELNDKVSRLRAALDPETQSRSVETLRRRTVAGPVFDRRVAHEIYREILAPLAAVTADAELYVVANGPLADLPLSVLVRSPPQGNDTDPQALRETDWLAASHPITMLPAPTGLRLAALQRERPRAPDPFVGFGDPEFSLPGDPDAPFARLARLPGTRTEVARLADLLGAGEGLIHLGPAASKAALLETDLSQARVIALATHGLLAGQMPAATEPGLVFSHPAAGAEAHESYLTASEAAALRINADWVLLSACNTAGPDGRADSEGLSGLARAFLFAGARSVLVSHWPVRDDAAMLLTTKALGWHAANPHASRAAALQHAMMTLIQRTDTPAFAHPSAWAPFVLVGDG